jgi:hypothetical protein
MSAENEVLVRRFFEECCNDRRGLRQGSTSGSRTRLATLTLAPHDESCEPGSKSEPGSKLLVYALERT